MAFWIPLAMMAAQYAQANQAQKDAQRQGVADIYQRHAASLGAPTYELDAMRQKQQIADQAAQQRQAALSGFLQDYAKQPGKPLPPGAHAADGGYTFDEGASPLAQSNEGLSSILDEEIARRRQQGGY